MKYWLHHLAFNNIQIFNKNVLYSGADPGFQVGGAQLKKLGRAEGGAKIFGVFREKNHDFTPTNYIFSNFRGAPPWIRPWY